MAAFSTIVLSALLALWVGANANQFVMRKEERALHLNPDGAAVDMSGTMPSDADDEVSSLEVFKGEDDGRPRLEDYSFEERSGPSEERSGPSEDEDYNDPCNTDYPIGVPNSNNCSIPGNHTLILDEGQCIVAAQATHARTHHGGNFTPFKKNSDSAPRGCYMDKCRNDLGQPVNGTCFYFNMMGGEPRDPKGTPVCWRPRFLKGTQDTNGLGADCPDGYKRIPDTKSCHEVAACLSMGLGEPFDYGVELNNSKHDDVPTGCFQHASEHVYWNPTPKNYGESKFHQGTPLCKVKQHTLCNDNGCKTVSSDAFKPPSPGNKTAGGGGGDKKPAGAKAGGDKAGAGGGKKGDDAKKAGLLF